MLRRQRAVDPSVTIRKLDGVADLLRRESEDAEADPYDEAMLNAVFGLIETMKAEAEAFGRIETRFGKLARRT